MFRRFACLVAWCAIAKGALAQGMPVPSSEKQEKKATSISIRSERNVVYGHAEGTDLFGDLYRPDTAERLPWVLMIHGGAWVTGDKWNLSDHARQMASAGFVVLNINYRLAPHSVFPSQLSDCQQALRWIESNSDQYHGDVLRLGVWGYSAGAQLAALLALNPESKLPKIKACIAGGAPCDLTNIPVHSNLLAPVFGGTRAEKPEVYRDASPITFASTCAPPIFFFHGTRDLIVPMASSLALHQQLKTLGASTEYLEIEGQGHLVTFVSPKARRDAIQFLQKHLLAP